MRMLPPSTWRRIASAMGGRESFGRASSINVDQDGAPVTCPAVEWFVCFVPGLRKQWWHRFAHAKYKHVYAMRPLGNGEWLIVEPWWTRMMIRVISLDQAMRYLRWGAAGTIIRAAEHVPGGASQMRGWSNCSVLVAFLLGRGYRTWTPNGLRVRLGAEPGTTRVELPEFLAGYARQLGQEERRAALTAMQGAQGEPLEALLQRAGVSMMSYLLHPSIICLCRTFIVESSRYPAAAHAFWRRGPGRVTAGLAGILAGAVATGALPNASTSQASRSFVSLLCGDLYLEALFGSSQGISPERMNAHVGSVVRIFVDSCTRPARKVLGSTPASNADRMA